jgi:hypothetical protein
MVVGQTNTRMKHAIIVVGVMQMGGLELHIQKDENDDVGIL